MTNNDALRSIRYILNIPDAKLIEIFALGGSQVTKNEISAFLKKDEEPGYEECPHEHMARFLNGLVTYKRGKDPTRPPQAIETPVTNNTVLKKIRVAFELKDTDLIAILEKSSFAITKTELSAFFRKPDHRNYRECGDQFLRNVLKGLAT